MAGVIRKLTFSEGIAVSPPDNSVLSGTASRVNGFTSITNYLTDKGTPVAAGDVFVNTTDDRMKYYNGLNWVSSATLQSYASDNAYLGEHDLRAAVAGDHYFSAGFVAPRWYNGSGWMVTQAQGEPYDALSATSLDIGGTNATTVNIGRSGQTTVIKGDLQVDGTTTTVNSTNLDVTDANITINSGGNDVSAEGSGLTIERAATDGSLVYEDSLTSKFKIGAVGSEVEVADVSSSQSFSNKTFTGSVGIGESTPLGKLHVKTADSGASASTSADDLIVENSGIAGMTIMSGTTSSGNIFFADSGSAAQGRVAYDHNSDSMALIVDDSDTVTIDSAADGARLGINESSPAGTLHVKAGTNGLYNIRCEGFNQGASANNNMIGFVGSNGAITGEIAESAGVLSLNDSSDARLKENIKSFDALDLIATAKPVEYNRIGQSEQEYGFIAQELYQSMPQFVKVGGEDVHKQPWTVSYGRMSPVLMRAIQQLAEDNDRKQDQIDRLEARLSDIENK